MPQDREVNKIKTQRASAGQDIAKIDATLSVLRIVMLYAFIAGLWILFSDQLLGLLIRDAGTITLISTLKGWFFVLVTSTLLYVLVRRLAGQLMSAHKNSRSSNWSISRPWKPCRRSSTAPLTPSLSKTSTADTR
jgi:hypothetical protein